MSLEAVLRLHALGLSVIPLQPRSKKPDNDVLPRDERGDAVWKPYQTTRATEAEIRNWFGNGAQRNIGIVCGAVSGTVVIETDSPEAEAWAAAHLPPTPMMTESARGFHRYYTRPKKVDVDIPRTLRIGSLSIEVKGFGQYVVGPGSIHPGKPEDGIPPGHVYREVKPWPSSLDAVPEFPTTLLLEAIGESPHGTTIEPLPDTIGSGGRNATLFREACRLRRLGWSESEISSALSAVNRERCHPPLDEREVSAIAHSASRYNAADDVYPTTEAGDAEFFARCYADVVRYDHRRGRWLLFDGNVWVPPTDGEIARLALEAIRARQRAAIGDKERMKWAFGGEARKRLINLLALAQSVKPIADAGDKWDTDPWLLGAPNGVIDLRTGTLRSGHPDDHITMRIRAPFHPDATCPTWDKTVAEIFEHNADLIAYFDRQVGYSMTGDCREESLAFCYGDGANGKGTLMNTVGWLLGDYADDLPFSAFELHHRSGIPNDIAKIVGKRFITASETAETQRLNEARVKALTGRDPITARFLHQEFFTFQPVAKFWLAANHKPDVRDDSQGFWRRIHLIPFNASFIGREDNTLKDKLRLELSGILARAVRGCLAWLREGLNPPAIVKEATDSYRADSMPLARFLDECCVVQETAKATFGDLFKAYLRWCGNVREEGRLTRREFGDALAMDERFKRVEVNQRVTYLGVGVVDLGRDGGDL